MIDTMRCPKCGGPTPELKHRVLAPENVIERRRRCVMCGEYLVTFEIIAGTPVVWQEIADYHWLDDEIVPPLRSKHYRPKVTR